ncbi:hypothetical protein PVAND_010199 [Polypedilum vanderplanki]|uniref:Uncharacterized protein n=1 Tax=Polypedilum vanderplanki TaxID=319348 RepID=A0A9J6CF52_POLVA|nr:hypothetical protein PVAND_010199 [Polypedilum vanderplanki]
MVRNNYDNQFELGILSESILCVGVALTLVTVIFFGIKLRWFRYRMNMQESESPVLLRSHSVTEIRENCSAGQYRQSLHEDMLIRTNNEFQPPSTSSSSSSYSVKSKSERESIFRWPFKNKMSLSKSQSLKENNRPSAITRSTSAPEETTLEKNDRIAHQMAMAEKNERLRRSIYESLHSNDISASMPDLVNESISPKMMKIQKGLEVSLEEETDEYQLTDEVQEIKSLESCSESQTSIQQEKEENEGDEINQIEEEEEKEEVIQIKPPTPPRRRSRSSSIKINQLLADSPDINSIPVLPVVLPRKKQMLANSNNIEPESFEKTNNEICEIERRRSSIDIIPKSILKTSETTNNSNSTVHFINVPESSSSEDETDDYEDDVNRHYSVWQQIDIHRDQLTQSYQLNRNEESSSPPPLPKTPPPKYEPVERDFSFA